MTTLFVLRGGGCSFPSDDSVHEAIREAIREGFRAGSQVLVGSVRGTVVGYNITRIRTHWKWFPGASYPLVVSTDKGIGLFCIDELELLPHDVQE